MSFYSILEEKRALEVILEARFSTHILPINSMQHRKTFKEGDKKCDLQIYIKF